MNFSLFKKMLFPAILAIAFAGCSALEEPVSSLDDGISKMLTLPVGSTYHTERVLSSSEPEYMNTAANIDSTMGTNFKIYEIGDAQTFNEGYTLGLSSSAIWLGSILDASGLPESKFDEVVFDRAPYTFSISLKGNGAPVAAQVNGTCSDYNQKLSDLLTSGVIKPQPDTAEFTMNTVYSREDLLLKAGLGFGYNKDDFSTKLRLLFDFNNTRIKTRVLIKFNQVYYSATIDKPSRPSKLFANGLQFSEFASKLSGSVSPVFISSIKYGRMGYLSVESEESEDIVKTAVNFVLANKNLIINADFLAQYTNAFKSTTMRLVMIGGGNASVSNITGGFNGFLNWVKEAADENYITSGEPIAFEMTYLKNNRMAEVYKVNKTYAVKWFAENTNVGTNNTTNTNIVRNFKISTDYYSPGAYYSVIGGVMSITYKDQYGHVIQSNGNNTMGYSNSMFASLIVTNINPNDFIVLYYKVNGTYQTPAMAFGTNWCNSGSYIVNCSNLIIDPNKYVNLIDYGDGNANFRITPQ